MTSIIIDETYHNTTNLYYVRITDCVPDRTLSVSPFSLLIGIIVIQQSLPWFSFSVMLKNFNSLK